MNTIELDYKRGKILRSKDKEGNWWKLEGECKRCGRCCGDNEGGLCKHLIFEDGIAVCKINKLWNKPGRCVLHPYSPDRKLFQGCGYKWVKGAIED